MEEKEKDVLSKGQEARARTRAYVIYVSSVCACERVRWEVSSERRGERKRKGADIPEGRLVGKELMHAKRGAGRKAGGGERKGSGRAGGREESTKRVYGRRINRRGRRYGMSPRAGSVDPRRNMRPTTPRARSLASHPVWAPHRELAMHARARTCTDVRERRRRARARTPRRASEFTRALA